MKLFLSIFWPVMFILVLVLGKCAKEAFYSGNQENAKKAEKVADIVIAAMTLGLVILFVVLLIIPLFKSIIM